jgi:hypothetical protein
MRNSEYVKIEEFAGLTFSEVYRDKEPADDNDRLVFITNTGLRFEMSHSQNCCEHVYLEDICGDLEDLVGEPIVEAEEVVSRNCDIDDEDPEARARAALLIAAEDEGLSDDSMTWTFYKLRTRKGEVTLRWYGSSNGYYSESVDLLFIEEYQK